MADVNGQDFFRRMTNTFGASSSITRFSEDYLASVNYALTDIGNRMDMDTKPTLADDTEDSIDLDTKYELALWFLACKYLLAFGNQANGYDYGTTSAEAERQLAAANARQRHDTQQTDEEDVVGVGYQE